jgi:hypothetical protein
MASTVAPQQEPKDATKRPSELFRYSAWVHVGADAEECEHRETGDCEDPEHFHAWCRLPNQLQHDDIRERALAAKARRIRQLHDPNADAHEILNADMEELRRTATREELINELVAKDWWKRHLEAVGDLDDDERFKHIEKDRERQAELRELAPEARPRDEWEELERHLAAYADVVDARRTEIEKPIRASLEQLTTEDLVNQIRGERINAESTNAFMESYSAWEWLAGTYTDNTASRQRSFSGIAQLAELAPEVLEAIRAQYSELEASLQRGPRGN